MEVQQEKTNFSETNEVKQKEKSKMLLPLLISLLILIFLSILFVFTRSEDFLDGKLPILEKTTEVPTGEIYLTLSPLGEQKPNIYKLDVETMVLEEYFPDSEYWNYMAKFSPDGDKMVFVKVDWGVDEDPVLTVALFDNKSKTILGETEPLNHFPRNPVFSLDGDSLAYWAFEEDGSFVLGVPEDNSIYIVSTDSFEREKVANGAFPIFFSADSIIYLKSDGLHMMDLSTKVEKHILDFPTDYPPKELLTEEQKEHNLPSWLFLRFEYCFVNNHLIIVNTASNAVFAYKFNNVLEEFEAEELPFEKGFNAPNWPVSSPDGKFLVVQEFEPDESSLPKVSLFNKSDWTQIKSFSLYEYEPNFIWISDWVVK